MMSGPAFGPYTLAFSSEVVSRGGIVTTTEKGYLTTFENSLGSDILEFDRIFIFGLSDSVAARTSFVNPSTTAVTAVNSPTFTPNLGYVGGATKYLNTNYNPSTQGVKFSLNNCSVSTYQSTTSPSGSMIGTFTGSNVTAFTQQTSASNQAFYMNQGVSAGNTLAGALKFTTINRISSTETNAYKNGILSNTFVVNSTNINNLNIWLLGGNFNNGLFDSTLAYCNLTSMGSTNFNQLNFYNAVQALGTSVGWAI